MWSNSIAVGSEAFVESVKNQLSLKAKYRATGPKEDAFVLKVPDVAYSVHLECEIEALSAS